MRTTLVTLSLLFTSFMSYSQVYTFDFYAHSSYTDGKPYQIVVLNDNW